MQGATAVALEQGLGTARDPEFASKFQRLLALRRRSPHSPLVLVLGSSRTLMGFRGSEIHTGLDGQPVVAFNFGIRGAGPVVELVCLRRLLAAGVRPDLLFVEVIPPVLNQHADHPLEEEWLNGARLTLAEIRQVSPYHSDPQRLLRHWLKSRWLPWAMSRKGLRDYVGSDWPEVVNSPDDPVPGRQDDHGWLPFFVRGITPERSRFFWNIARRQYQAALGDFHLATQPARALEDLLALCRDQHIPVALLLMPEGSQFQALYPPSMRAGIDRYLAELSRSHDVPVIDARSWLPDDAFWDSHHQLPTGATIFTALFEREVLQPWLEPAWTDDACMSAAVQLGP